MSNDTFNWRTQASCDERSPDAFQTVEDLMEDFGFAESVAQAHVDMNESAMKALCKGCPVRGRCKDEAMLNDEAHGVWGMMSTSERVAYRPTWLKIKKLQGVILSPVVKDQDVLHVNPGVDSRYQERNRRVRDVRDRLMMNPGFVLRTAKYGTHSYDQFMQILDVVLAHPHSSAQELASRMGRGSSWFNGLLQEVSVAMDVCA